ncbi:hypothetical protein TWF694_010926 [Orbilia ellipsospora]|uniref:Uncharacterized protein n=1 Tax=Orbilia ellipsospora TaxID=2528407 RepID=A0AAV9X7V9_9PEZI
MAHSTPKMILFLGAPSAASLLSSEDRLLTYPTSPFEPVPDPNATRIEDYLGTGTLPTISSFNPTGATAPSNEERANDHVAELQASSGRLKPLPIPAWRVLPLRPPVLHTGYTQRAYDPTPSIYAWRQRCERSFSASRSITAANDQPIPLSPTVPHLSFDEEDTQDSYATDTNGSFLLERSYAVHNLPTSQVPPPSAPSPPPPSSSPLRHEPENETSIYDDDDDDDETFPPAPLPPLPITRVTDLEDLPSPTDLLNPYKTFMTTILVGIMKVESQVIKTKYTNESNPSGQVELLTITVGDYTFAGLQVKIWLPLPSPRQNQSVENVNPSTINGLEKCRYIVRGDIVLFQDLVLSNFNGIVYANSLKRERSKAIFVYRDKRGLRADLSDPVDTTVEKVRRVREWVRGYVGYEGDDELEGMPMESF